MVEFSDLYTVWFEKPRSQLKVEWVGKLGEKLEKPGGISFWGHSLRQVQFLQKPSGEAGCSVWLQHLAVEAEARS